MRTQFHSEMIFRKKRVARFLHSLPAGATRERLNAERCKFTTLQNAPTVEINIKVKNFAHFTPLSLTLTLFAGRKLMECGRGYGACNSTPFWLSFCCCCWGCAKINVCIRFAENSSGLGHKTCSFINHAQNYYHYESCLSVSSKQA